MAERFRFQSEKVHLTYKGFLDFDALKTWAESLAEVKLMSIVHERGDEDEADATPYEHTHFFVWWKTRVRQEGAAWADIGGIHPNSQTRRAMDWAKHVCMVYHKGNKKKANGKKYFIAPVAIYQVGVEDWKFEEDMFKIAKAAPSMEDACLDLGIVPKSIADVLAIRRECERMELSEPEPGNYVPYTGPEWNPAKQSLVISGVPGICKTAWAVNYFKGKGFVITDIDDLKKIPRGCKGLIFDDTQFAKEKLSVQKHVADVRKPASIRCRQTNGRKPKLPAIFTTNALDDLFDFNGHGGALQERTVVWRVQGVRGSKSMLA